MKGEDLKIPVLLTAKRCLDPNSPSPNLFPSQVTTTPQVGSLGPHNMMEEKNKAKAPQIPLDAHLVQVIVGLSLL
jgi:hypothetical protein